MVKVVRRADQDDERVSDGSDTENDRGDKEEFLANALGENELVELHDQALEAELHDYIHQIFKSNSGDKDFHSFRYMWCTDQECFEPRRTKACLRNRGLGRKH